MCLQGCFQVRLGRELADWVREITLCSVDGNHPIRWVAGIQQKGRGRRSCCLCGLCELGHQPSPALGLGLTSSVLLMVDLGLRTWTGWSRLAVVLIPLLHLSTNLLCLPLLLYLMFSCFLVFFLTLAEHNFLKRWKDHRLYIYIYICS